MWLQSPCGRLKHKKSKEPRRWLVISTNWHLESWVRNCMSQWAIEPFPPIVDAITWPSQSSYLTDTVTWCNCFPHWAWDSKFEFLAPQKNVTLLQFALQINYFPQHWLKKNRKWFHRYCEGISWLVHARYNGFDVFSRSERRICHVQNFDILKLHHCPVQAVAFTDQRRFANTYTTHIFEHHGMAEGTHSNFEGNCRSIAGYLRNDHQGMRFSPMAEPYSCCVGIGGSCEPKRAPGDIKCSKDAVHAKMLWISACTNNEHVSGIHPCSYEFHLYNSISIYGIYIILCMVDVLRSWIAALTGASLSAWARTLSDGGDLGHHEGMEKW